MIKALVSLLCLSSLFYGACLTSSSNVVNVRRETPDIAKVGAEGEDGGVWSFEEEGGWKFSEEGSATYTDEEACSGSKSLHIVRSNTDSYFTATNTTPFSIEGGKRYRIGFFYKSQHSYGVSLTMNVQTFDSSGNQLRTIEGGNNKLNADALSSSWNECFIEFQAKNDAVSATMSIIVKYGAADLYVDKASCTLTGDDVYDETFSLPKADGTLLNWDMNNASVVDDALLIENGGEAKAVWKRFLLCRR